MSAEFLKYEAGVLKVLDQQKVTQELKYVEVLPPAVMSNARCVMCGTDLSHPATRCTMLRMRGQPSGTPLATRFAMPGADAACGGSDRCMLAACI